MYPSGAEGLYLVVDENVNILYKYMYINVYYMYMYINVYYMYMYINIKLHVHICFDIRVNLERIIFRQQCLVFRRVG